MPHVTIQYTANLDPEARMDALCTALAEVICAKHRNGPTETIKLNFVKRYAKFSDHRAA